MFETSNGPFSGLMCDFSDFVKGTEMLRILCANSHHSSLPTVSRDKKQRRASCYSNLLRVGVHAFIEVHFI